LSKQVCLLTTNSRKQQINLQSWVLEKETLSTRRTLCFAVLSAVPTVVATMMLIALDALERLDSAASTWSSAASAELGAFPAAAVDPHASATGAHSSICSASASAWLSMLRFLATPRCLLLSLSLV
jgi:hypothetical protein